MLGPEQAGPPSWTGGEATLPGLVPEAPQRGIQHPPGTRLSPLNLKTTGWLWCLDLHSLPSRWQPSPPGSQTAHCAHLLGPFQGTLALGFLLLDNMKNIQPLPSSIQQSWVRPKGSHGQAHTPQTSSATNPDKPTQFLS